MHVSTTARVPDRLDLAGLRAAYAAGLSPHAVVDSVLVRIAARGDDAMWISRFDAAALHARAAGLEASEHRGPLFGVPFAIKDNIDVAGLPTTAACPDFAYSPAADATAVRLLQDAGAIAIGKTNLDQFATGLNGTRSPYGACESVFGQDLVSGGSSSGSAVAVAAGTAAFALGTDTAGSGRVPAAMNGIVGLKPTRGLVSTHGVVPACRSLDCVSVFTTGVEDAATVLDVLAGFDPADPWSRPAPPTTARTAPPDSGRPRLLLPTPGGLDHEGDVAYAAAFTAIAGNAATRAESVEHIELGPLLEAGDLLYTGPWVAERRAGLAAFIDAHPASVLPVIHDVLAPAENFDAEDAFRARHRLQELRAWTDRLWDRADVLLLPTVPTTFTRTQLLEQPLRRNLVLGRYTQFANLLDLAAVAVPAGVTADGRPVGVTLLGPAFSERRLLSAATALLTMEAA